MAEYVSKNEVKPYRKIFDKMMAHKQSKYYENNRLTRF